MSPTFGACTILEENAGSSASGGLVFRSPFWGSAQCVQGVDRYWKRGRVKTEDLGRAKMAKLESASLMLGEFQSLQS